MHIKLKYLIFLVVIVCAVVMAPLINGYFFKNSYLSLMTALNDDNPIKITVTDYQRGWFSSEVKLELIIQSAETMKLNADQVNKVTEAFKKVIITQHIAHGPCVNDSVDNAWKFTRALIDTTVHVPRLVEDVLLGDSAPKGVMQVHTSVSYDNLYRSHIRVPTMAVDKTEKGKGSWAGINGILDIKIVNNYITLLKSDFTLGAVNFQVGTESFLLQPIALQSEIHCDSPATLCSSNGKMAMPGLVSNMRDSHFQLSDLTFISISGMNSKNAFNSAFTIGLTKFEMPNFTMGPVNINISVRDLSVESLAKLKERANEARQDIRQGGDATAEGLLFLAQANLELPHLITPDTVFSQDVSIKTSYGDFKLQGQFSWPTNMPLPRKATDFQKANMHVNLRASTSLVDMWLKMLDAKAADKKIVSEPITPALTQFPNMLDAAKAKQIAHSIAPNPAINNENRMKFDETIKNGFVIQDKDDYVTSITYENNVLKVNGIVVPLPPTH